MFETGSCRSCGAPVIWACAANSRIRMPVDAEPTVDGNLILSKNGDVVTFTVIKRAIPGNLYYVSHFFSCPEAETWRRKYMPKPKVKSDE